MYEMLTIQKNTLFDEIRKANLDPALFKIDEDEDLATVMVVGLPLQFDILRSENSFHLLTYRFKHFAPNWPYARPVKPRNYANLPQPRKDQIAAEMAAGWFPTGKWCQFSEVATAFRGWLQYDVKPALNNAAAPDLWAEAAASLPEFDELPSEYAEFFSPEQQQQIHAAIEHFKVLINREFAPDPEQMGELNLRLDYLAEAVNRLNRFDWKSLALATVIGVATNLNLDTQTGRAMWALFRQALHAVSHLLVG